MIQAQGGTPDVTQVCGMNAPVQTKTFPKKAPPFQEMSLKWQALGIHIPYKTVARIVCATHLSHTCVQKSEENPPTGFIHLF